MAVSYQSRPVALTIAGSDSSGGAGIQADLKTFTRLECYGASAITAVTAQNTHGVQGVTLLTPDVVIRQIDSICSDLQPQGTKTGMLGSAAMVRAVAEAIAKYKLQPLVVDPVMIAKSGDTLIDEDAVKAVIEYLLPLATLVTPNRHEAARIAGFGVETVEDAIRAARHICNDLNASACVVKAIRQVRDGKAMSVDVLYGAGDGDARLFPHRWHEIGQPNTHGSGCTFSAALTAELARGEKLENAVAAAVRHIDDALASPVRIGGGISPVDHLAIGLRPAT